MGATNPNAGGAPGGGGKGGMGMNRGPGGNAQNNPGMGQSPMAAFGRMNNLHQGLGSAGAYGPSAGVSQMPAPNTPGNPINSTANSVGQSMGGGPMANWQSMLKGFGGGGMGAFNLPPNFGGGGHGFGRPMPGHRPDMSQFGNLDMTYGKLGGGPKQTIEDLVQMEKGWGMGGGGGNFTPPTPQPQEPIGGYINGQPAQFHHQAQALNNPQPQTTAAGLPAGGLLARLYGG